jgi:hypothetical protein
MGFLVAAHSIHVLKELEDRTLFETETVLTASAMESQLFSYFLCQLSKSFEETRSFGLTSSHSGTALNNGTVTANL